MTSQRLFKEFEQNANAQTSYLFNHTKREKDEKIEETKRQLKRYNIRP